MKYEWSFGDSSGGTGESISHTYTTSGTYTIGLRITDDKRETSSVSEMLTVRPPSSPLPPAPVDPEPPQAGSTPLYFEGNGPPPSRLPFISGGGEIFFISGGAVNIFDQHGNWVGLVANQQAITLAAHATYYLDVIADGVWAVTILSGSYRPPPPQTYTGQGQQLWQYTSLFSLARGTATFYIELEGWPGYGSSVVLLDRHRDWAELVLSPSEGFDDRARVDVSGGDYLLKTRAGSAWEISVEQ